MFGRSITYALFGSLILAGAALAAEPKTEMENLPAALPVADQLKAQPSKGVAPSVTGPPTKDTDLRQQQAAMALIYLLISSKVNPAQLLR